MFCDAERVERDAGIDAAACGCQERAAPAHAKADRRNSAAAEGLRAQPPHRNASIIRRVLPVESIEPLPGPVCLLERHHAGESRAPKHIGGVSTPAALRVVLCHFGLRGRNAPHLTEDDKAWTTSVRRSG